MSKPEQESILKETGDLLEAARDEVLKEINKKRGLLGRVFSKGNSESLARAQSSISKAINQMKNFDKDESGLIGKLQKHLNQKAEDLKRLEEEFENKQKESSELRDKIKFYENEFEKLKALKPTEAKVEARPESHKIEQDFKAKIKELEESNREIRMNFAASKEELVEAEKLTTEFAVRLKRLKSEITS